jgi:hypothetical protein
MFKAMQEGVVAIGGTARVARRAGRGSTFGWLGSGCEERSCMHASMLSSGWFVCLYGWLKLVF